MGHRLDSLDGTAGANYLLFLNRLHQSSTTPSGLAQNFTADHIQRRIIAQPPLYSPFSPYPAYPPPHYHGSYGYPLYPNFNTTRYTPYPPNALANLVLYGILSILGTTFNVFEISTLVVQECLRKRGNLLLANQALCNLLVTAGSFPVTIVAILAVAQDSRYVCYTQWYCALLSFFTNLFNFLCIAGENYVKSCRPEEMEESATDRRLSTAPIIATRPGKIRVIYRTLCNTFIIITLTTLTWVISITWCLATVFVTRGLDVCVRDMRESRMFIALAVPALLTTAIYIKAINEQRDYTIHLEMRNCLATREQILHRRLLRTNFTAFLFFLLFWSPFLFLVIVSPPLNDATTTATHQSLIDNLFFVAESFSCFCPLIYGTTHDAFRQGFVYLTHYFCCKSHPELPRPPMAPDDKQRAVARIQRGLNARLVERRHRTTKMSTMGLLSFAGGNEMHRLRVEEDFL